MRPTKVLIFGIDGGTFDLALPWIREGRLPTLKRLMDRGVSCELTVDLPPVTVPNWPSFMTGKNAGKHGVVHWFIRKEGQWEWSLASSDAIKAKMLWEIAGEKGRKSIVVNVPATYPPRPIDGIMVTGLLTPPMAKDFVHPPEVKDELEARFGKYSLYSSMTYQPGREDLFFESVLRGLDERFAATMYLMKEHPWDIFTIVYGESDLMQHMFWKFIDPHHPLYVKEMADKYGDGVAKIYEKIDAILGEYLREAGEDTQVIVMSDHGADPFYQKFFTNNWLIDLGFMKIKKGFVSGLKHWAFRRGFTINTMYRLFLKMGFINWTNKVSRNESAESLVRKLFLSYEDVDWEKTTAFAFGGFGQIYMNVKNDGATMSGGETASYGEARDRIIAGLREIMIPGVGPLVEEIYTREELYWGPNTSVLPDIVFIPRKGYLDPGDFEFSSNKRFDDAILGSGTHSRRGLFIMSGPAVRHSPDFAGATIHDIAPTALYLAGVPVPGDMDGRILLETLTDEWLDDHPPLYDESSGDLTGPSHTYSADEEEDIKKQLKGLGYLS